MSGYPPLPVRLWRMRPWRSNSLIRASDRIQALAGMFAIAVALLAVPLAGAAGTAGYTDAVARIRVENATKTETTATVMAKPQRTVIATREHGPADERYEAAVQWNYSGKAGTAIVAVPSGSALGAAVPIWLEPDGQPTTAPKGTDAAVGEGVGAGLALLAGAWGGALLLTWGVDRLLGARRAASWDREWRRISRPLGQDS
ncbi:Rv1733c family protein [Nocardia asiatica]|uniref:Rv1733c family protein n=1 Tax=Nocardia asiatica TaxID=209252 RepID=UPI002454E5F1|nr:hypothetical protein [Nocardia asiatica]